MQYCLGFRGAGQPQGKQSSCPASRSLRHAAQKGITMLLRCIPWPEVTVLANNQREAKQHQHHQKQMSHCLVYEPLVL